jgi:hypothetical protein
MQFKSPDFTQLFITVSFRLYPANLTPHDLPFFVTAEQVLFALAPSYRQTTATQARPSSFQKTF